MGAYNLNFNTPGPATMPRRIAATPGNTPLNLDFMSQLNAGGTNTPSSFLNLGTTPSVTDQVIQDSQSLIPGTTINELAAGGGGGGETGMFDNFLGEDGWGNMALGGANAAIQGYMGFKQLGLAKDQLDFQKKAFEKNYNAQKQSTNTQLRDRQKRRYTENPGHYVSPDEYMSQNGVK